MSDYDKISSELHTFQGNIFKELTLPVCSSVESRVFRGGSSLSGAWIAAAALNSFSLKPEEMLLFELYGSNSKKGPFYRYDVPAAVRGPKTFTAGEEILHYVPETETKRFLKLKISDNANLSHAVITVYLAGKA